MLSYNRNGQLYQDHFYNSASKRFTLFFSTDTLRYRNTDLPRSLTHKRKLLLRIAVEKRGG
jgi:hypothetical protein